MKFYVYNAEDRQHVATITGSSNAACEAAFEEHFGNDYGATYTPAFGFNDGLVENPDAEEIDADEA